MTTTTENKTSRRLWSEKLINPIVEQFKEATGIQVKAKYGKTSEIAALILEEGEKEHYDLLFG